VRPGSGFLDFLACLRTLATSNPLKPLSSKGSSRIRNQQVSGSSPLAGSLKTKDLRPDAESGLLCIVPNFVPTALLQLTGPFSISEVEATFA
jgi:hypothetical protein